MRKKSGPQEATTEPVVKDIRRKTRKVHSAEEKIRIVLEVYDARFDPKTGAVKLSSGYQ